MKHLLPWLACLLPLAPFAQKHKTTAKTVQPAVAKQDTGVQFVHHLTWSDVQRKAKAENKYIFMDCYTTWCGPCKMMSKTIFPQKAVGDAMNNKFIAVKMQIDTSDADNDEVKSLYATAHAIDRNYKINVYPTYLFFNPDGELVHRAVGFSEADAFIAKTEEALNPETQYYAQLKQYDKGRKDSAFLHRLVNASLNAYDIENGGKVMNDYFATQTNLYTPENLTLLQYLTRSSADMGFRLMLQNPERVDSVLGKGTATGLLTSIIMREEVYPMLVPAGSNTAGAAEPDWNSIETALQSKYPAQAAQVLAYSKMLFYRKTQNWDKFGPAVTAYVKSNGENISDEQLNDFAWTVFQNCADETCLQNALNWSRQSFAGEQNPAYMDTYANLLYRLGRKDEALQWEQKALDLIPDAEKQGYQQTMDKMRAGEKTWN